jgi:hypothetical protein
MVGDLSNEIIRTPFIRFLDKQDAEISIDPNGKRARGILDRLKVQSWSFGVLVELCDSFIRTTSQRLA